MYISNNWNIEGVDKPLIWVPSGLQAHQATASDQSKVHS